MKLFNKYPAQIALAFLLILFVISIGLIQRYIEAERQRDLLSWQNRLGIIADMHKLSLEKLVNQQKNQLISLSQTPTLQLYLSRFGTSTGQDDDIRRAQATYVRNLLQASAQRMGLGDPDNSNINREFKTRSSYGLAVLNAQSKLLFASHLFDNNLQKLQPQIAAAMTSAQPQLINLQADARQQAIYGFVMPVFPIQKLQSSQAVGAVIAILNPYHGLFKELKNPHLSTRSDESLLITRQGRQLVYISPLKPPAQIFHSIPANVPQLAASQAAQQPGSLIIQPDYRGETVLAIARKISHTPWLLIQKIDAAEALKESDEHQQFLLTTFSLLSLFLAVLLIAVWRHSSSLRLQKLSRKLEARTTLLNAVSDNINEHIFLLDKNSQLIFANHSLLARLGLCAEEIDGKHMGSILGADAAKRLQQCQTRDSKAGCIMELTLAGQTSSYHVSVIKLGSGEYKDSSLYVLHDISQIQEMQQKRDRLAQGIIRTLVKATDLHDPFCANHSERTREVAIEIGRALGLEEPRLQTLEMAALLANIGKLFVPREILTKMEALNEEENQQLRKHIDYAVDILRQLDFEGPVVEIIAQKNEHLDGSGYPAGLKAEQLLLESRILAVANAFVAMSSSRAYRPGRPLNEVLESLLQQADTQYDRHIIAALFHIAENKSNWASWQSITEN